MGTGAGGCGDERDLRWRRSKSGEGCFNGMVLQTEKADLFMEMWSFIGKMSQEGLKLERGAPS